MNKTTRDIAALLKIDLEAARLVQESMENEGFDFSECTQRSFRKAVLAQRAS